jgi:hypothetical protein
MRERKKTEDTKTEVQNEVKRSRGQRRTKLATEAERLEHNFKGISNHVQLKPKTHDPAPSQRLCQTSGKSLSPCASASQALRSTTKRSTGQGAIIDLKQEHPCSRNKLCSHEECEVSPAHLALQVSQLRGLFAPPASDVLQGCAGLFGNCPRGRQPELHAQGGPFQKYTTDKMLHRDCIQYETMPAAR